MRPPSASHGGKYSIGRWRRPQINNPYRGINTNRAFTMARVRTCLGPNNVRAPPCSPHGLSAEGSGSRSTMPVRMKSLIGDYLGQSSVFVGKKTKGGVGWRRSRPTVIIGQRGGGTRGEAAVDEQRPLDFGGRRRRRMPQGQWRSSTALIAIIVDGGNGGD